MATDTSPGALGQSRRSVMVDQLHHWWRRLGLLISLALLGVLVFQAVTRFTVDEQQQQPPVTTSVEIPIPG